MSARRVTRITWIMLAGWTVLVVGSLASQMWQHDAEVRVLARSAAYLSFKKDMLFWDVLTNGTLISKRPANDGRVVNTHGVYMPVTPKMPPDPHLSHIPDRDITTPSGQKLTLMSPERIIRQMYTLGEKEDDAWGHLTSLKTIRPENAPDPWEAKALRALEGDNTPVYSVESFKGQPALRMMREVEAKKECLQCHAAQGYQEGKACGGISVTVPLGVFEGVAKRRLPPTGMAHLILWAVGSVSLFVGGRRLRKGIEEQNAVEDLLRESESRFQLAMAAADQGIFDWHIQGNRVYRNPSCSTMLGYQPGEIDETAEGWVALLHPDDREFMVGKLRGIREGKADYCELDYRIRSKDGQWRWFHSRGKVMEWDAGGLAARMTGTHVDITESKRLENALRESEDAVQALLDAATDSMFLLSENLTIISCNEIGARRLKHGPEEIVGLPILDLYPAEIAARCKSRIDEMREIRRPLRFEEVLDGRILDHHLLPVTDEQGNIYRIALFAWDVTEQRQAEAARDRLYEALNASQNEVFLFDAGTLRFDFVSAGAMHNLGYSLDQLLRMTPLDLKPEHTPESFARLLQPLRNHEVAVIQFETVQRRLDGSLYPVEVHLQLLERADESVFLAVVLDITERRLAENERERLESELRHAQKMEAIGTLATGIAHDFNNLLTGVAGYTELAKGHLMPDHPSRQAMEIVGNAVRDASGITNLLLTFGRKTSTSKAPASFVKVVGESIALLQRLLPASVQVGVEYNCDEEVYVYADVGQLHQVVMNLVTNARDAMPDGGKVSITVSEEEKRGATVGRRIGGSHGVLLIVEDTGTGMPPEIVSKIFDPFFTTKPRGKGTGLGLAMVHGIIQDHGGRIDVQTTPGKGTRIAIRLPCCPPPASEQPVQEVKIVDDGAAHTVLVAEDNELVRGIVVKTLTASGLIVLEASNGPEAIARLQQGGGDIHLVVLDIDLPGRSGLQCREEMRKAHPTVPIIFITGSPEAELDDAMDDYSTLLRKPFKMPELASLVRLLLSGPT